MKTHIFIILTVISFTGCSSGQNTTQHSRKLSNLEIPLNDKERLVDQIIARAESANVCRSHLPQYLSSFKDSAKAWSISENEYFVQIQCSRYSDGNFIQRGPIQFYRVLTDSETGHVSGILSATFEYANARVNENQMKSTWGITSFDPNTRILTLTKIRAVESQCAYSYSTFRLEDVTLNIIDERIKIGCDENLENPENWDLVYDASQDEFNPDGPPFYIVDGIQSSSSWFSSAKFHCQVRITVEGSELVLIWRKSTSEFDPNRPVSEIIWEDETTHRYNDANIGRPLLAIFGDQEYRFRLSFDENRRRFLGFIAKRNGKRWGCTTKDGSHTLG